MSISVQGVVRVTAPTATQSNPSADSGTTAATRTPGHADGSANVHAPVELDATTQQPKPPRFPWLSRLTSELEPAAKQKPAFPSAPSLGENLDQAV